jgi:predicted acylesterase/phospholipase RssA
MNNTINAKQFEHCMVMAGGGFCFGYYLGMYEAARQAGKTPDILLASCGGSIAAALINSLPDDAARREWIASPEMHRFWLGVQSSPRASIVSALWHAWKRKLFGRGAPLIPDLFDDYFFEIPPSLPLPPPATATSETTPVAILGGRLLFGREDVGQPRRGRKLFVETLFCGERAAQLLDGMVSPFADAAWGQHAIAPQVDIDTKMALADAVRISISDMFYFPCLSVNGQSYTGGMVDLFPLEAARRLARTVTMEFKAPFDQFYAIPAWQAVLGIDGNRRLKQVHSEPVDHWVDTSDVFLELKGKQVEKKVVWHKNRFSMVTPASYDAFRRQIDAHWQYGYERGREAFAPKADSGQRKMRFVTQFNASMP